MDFYGLDMGYFNQQAYLNELRQRYVLENSQHQHNISALEKAQQLHDNKKLLLLEDI